MKTDRTAKFLLLVIAMGLWMNVVVSLWRPDRVGAQNAGDIEKRLSSLETSVEAIETSVDAIQSDVDSIETGVRSLQTGVISMEDSVEKIANGTCTNGKIC